MSRTAAVALTGLFLSCVLCAAGGQEPKDVKVFVGKVIDAYGGEKKLSQVKAVAFTRKTTMTKEGKSSTQKVTIQLPDQLRSETEFELDGKKVMQIYIRVSAKGWLLKADKVEEKMYTEEQVENFPRALKYQMGLFALQFKDPDRKLEPLGEVKVGDKATVGVKVSDTKESKVPPRNYFFDKKTNLLVKREMTLKDKEGKEFTFAMFYHNYKCVDGIAMPYKTVSKKDGEVIIEQELTEFRVLDKADPKLFQKPEVQMH